MRAKTPTFQSKLPSDSINDKKLPCLIVHWFNQEFLGRNMTEKKSQKVTVKPPVYYHQSII